MGCWDVFCFICGNPCHSIIDNYEYLNEEIKSSYPKYAKDILKRLQSRKNLITEIKKLSKDVKWMDKCSILLENNKVIHGVKEMNCNVVFCKNNECYEHISMSLDQYDNEKHPTGFFIHTDCWKYIQKNYNINLQFSHLPPYVLKQPKNFDINYGDIEKYWEQDFNFPEVVFDNKQYLCSSPLKNDKNISQIKKNISKFKLKNDPNRKGPAISATFYKEGDIKIGSNNNFWIIKGNKWVEMNEKPIKIKIKVKFDKLEKKQIKFLYNISYIGQYSKNPIFLISIDKNDVELVLLESYKDKLII